MLLYCATLLQVLLGIYCKSFYWIPSFTIPLLFYVFEIGKAKSATSSVLMILTRNGLFQKNFQTLGFYFTPKNVISLTLPHPFPPVCFFHYSIVLWFPTVTILLIQAPLPIATVLHKSTLFQLKMHIWMEFFRNQKFIFLHKINFNPKVINYF